MNDMARRIMMDRRRSGSDYARGGRKRDRGSREEMYDGRRDRGGDYGYEDYAMRRGSDRNSDYGTYDYADDYSRRDRNDYGDYGRDYGSDLRLTRRDMMDWKRDLENADGTMGEHFDFATIKQTAQAFNLPMKHYDEKELCMTANMLYSDYCDVLKQFIPRDKEAMAYVKFAQAFLEDPDASVKGGEKLAAYYYAIVDDE